MLYRVPKQRNGVHLHLTRVKKVGPHTYEFLNDAKYMGAYPAIKVTEATPLLYLETVRMPLHELPFDIFLIGDVMVGVAKWTGSVEPYPEL